MNIPWTRFSLTVFQGVSLDWSVDKISVVSSDQIEDLVRDAKVASDAEATFNAMFHICIGGGNFVSKVTIHQDVCQRWYPEVFGRASQWQREFVNR